MKKLTSQEFNNICYDLANKAMQKHFSEQEQKRSQKNINYKYNKMGKELAKSQITGKFKDGDFAVIDEGLNLKSHIPVTKKTEFRKSTEEFSNVYYDNLVNKTPLKYFSYTKEDKDKFEKRLKTEAIKDHYFRGMVPGAKIGAGLGGLTYGLTGIASVASQGGDTGEALLTGLGLGAVGTGVGALSGAGIGAIINGLRGSGKASKYLKKMSESQLDEEINKLKKKGDLRDLI